MKGKIRPAVSLLAVMLIMTGTAGTQSAAAASSQRIDSASTEKQADRYVAAEDTHALPHYRPQLRWESAERAKNVPEALSKGQNTRVDKAIPIIITAADVDAQRKQKRQEIKEPVRQASSSPSVAPALPLEKQIAAPVMVKGAGQTDSDHSTALRRTADSRPEQTTALPPIQPVPAARNHDAIVELPPVQPVPVRRASAVVELPPVLPVPPRH